MPRATQPSLSSGPTSVNNGDFGSRFGWYVEADQPKDGANWYKALVDPNTPRGAQAYIDFTIAPDGSVGNVRLDRSSGSPTLDSSCMRAAQRVTHLGRCRRVTTKAPCWFPITANTRCNPLRLRYNRDCDMGSLAGSIAEAAHPAGLQGLDRSIDTCRMNRALKRYRICPALQHDPQDSTEEGLRTA